MKITAKDIANICGVSIGTVDRALHDRPRISRDTKEKILRVAKELNYRPNYHAKSLVMGKSMTIGVVLFDLHYNLLFPTLAHKIEQAIREAGYFMLLHLTQKESEEEIRCLNLLAGMNSDGIILYPSNRGLEFERFLKSLPTNVVTIGNKISSTLPFVGAQNRDAMKRAVSHICGKGYRRIVYFSPALSHAQRTNMFEEEERYKGYQEGMRKNLPDSKQIVIKEFEYENVLEEVFNTPNERTAILCSDDAYALQVMSLARKRGLGIPDDIGVMGFGNITFLKYVTPVLTTISYPSEEIAVNAFKLLMLGNGGRKRPHSHLAGCPLIEGESL